MTKPRIPLILNSHGQWVIKPAQQNEIERLFARLDEAVNGTLSIIEPILKAGGGAKPQDRQAMRPIVFQTLMERLHGFSKDELLAVTTSIIADRIMQDIEARPWGGDKPDLLSGQ